MIKLVIFAGLIGFCLCEAPYAASGYKPSPAESALPGEYGAPPLPASVQVSHENVEFAGQTVEVNTGVQRPNNAAYYTPSNQFAQLKTEKVRSFFTKKKFLSHLICSELNRFFFVVVDFIFFFAVEK